MSVQLLSRVRLFATPCITACQASLSITNSQSLPKPISIESVMPSSHLILCHPLLYLSPILPSIRVFSNESTLCMRWPKYWSFSFNISPSNEHPGLISFRMDWLDLAVQGTLKGLLQHHISKASVLLCSAFFTVQLSHPYMTTGKTIALTRWTFVGEVLWFPLKGYTRQYLWAVFPTRWEKLTSQRAQTSWNHKLIMLISTSVQLLCHVWLFATPWTAARQASLSITNSQSLLKLISYLPTNENNVYQLITPAFNHYNSSLPTPGHTVLRALACCDLLSLQSNKAIFSTSSKTPSPKVYLVSGYRGQIQLHLQGTQHLVPVCLMYLHKDLHESLPKTVWFIGQYPPPHSSVPGSESLAPAKLCLMAQTWTFGGHNWE